jgi:hypothetical protein
MRRLLVITLTLLVPLAMAGLACAQEDSGSAAAQQDAEEEHPEGEAEGEEHPEGEPGEDEEHPEGEPGEDEEHPEGEGAEGEEHPEGEGEEHPEEEEPPAQAAAEPLTIDELADAITEWVATESIAGGGYLVIDHPDTGESLELTLDKVHRERLSRVGEQTYFACADFVGRDGTLYDLDVFMEGSTPETLETTEVTLHKVDGEARYTWYEEDGLWKKRPAA